MELYEIIIALVIGIYEVIIRVIPTVSNYSIIHKIIQFLKLISDFFNKER